MTKTAVPQAKPIHGKKRTRGRAAQEASERPVVLIRLPEIRPGEAGAEEHGPEPHGSQRQRVSQVVPSEDSTCPKGLGDSAQPVEPGPASPKPAARDVPWSPPVEPWLGNPSTKRLMQIAAAATLIVLVISAYLVATAVRPTRVVVAPADHPSEARMEIPHLPPPDFSPVPRARPDETAAQPAAPVPDLAPALPMPEEAADTEPAGTKPAPGPELLEPLTASSDPKSDAGASRPADTDSKSQAPKAEEPQLPQPETGALEVLEPSAASEPPPSPPASAPAADDATARMESPEPAAEAGAQAARSYPVTDPATFQYPAYQELFRAPAGQAPAPSDRWIPHETQPNTARLQPRIVPPPIR